MSGDTSTASSPEKLAKRGDFLFLIGCCLCGSWILGPIGAPLIFLGLWWMRKAELQGAAIRPWQITIVAGLILCDSAVNCLAWSVDLYPAHSSLIGRTLFSGYGLLADGGYGLFYNTMPADWASDTYSLGGNYIPGEKAMQISFCILVMPMRIAAAWGLLKMKRWGLQWSIVANWMYMTIWIAYAANMTLQFPLRFGTTEFGVLGFWLIAGLPFLGPLVLLPYLHSVNRELWTTD